jgi:hypothetical protein
MAATLAAIQTFAVGNPDLRQRFQAARLQVAWNIMAEPGTTTNHAARVVWAKKIFGDYSKDLDKEYLWYLSDSNVQTAGNGVTDAQIVSGASALVDSWTV